MNKRDIIDLSKQLDLNNLELLEIIKELLVMVVGNIENTNDLTNEDDYYDLGNGYSIDNEDLESVVSSLETITDIIDYNKVD